MNKHTPGPWFAKRPFPDDEDDYGTGIWIEAADSDGFMSSLAQVRYGCTEAAEVGDIKANALLISAAPDLLAALEMLLNETNAGTWECLPVDLARAAIAKAKGGADVE